MRKIYLPGKQFKILIFSLSLFLNLVICCNTAGQTQQVFNTTGSFTIPLGVTQITVECWGAGGNGGSTINNGTKTGGGGGGAYARKLLTVTPSTSYNFTVGTGGGDTYFINATTVLAKGGSSVAAESTIGTAGGSALSSIGDQVYGGGNGGNAGANTGGGGSSAGNSANGNNASGVTGGAAPGGGGAGANGLAANANGSVGNTPGGGGSGGWKQGSGGSLGAGAIGKVVISYYLLTSTSAATPCQNTSATVTLSATAANLPIGTYTVTYNLTGANTATNAIATMTTTAAGTLIYSTINLPNTGSTTITVTKLVSGFYASSSIGASNTSTFTVSSAAQPTVSAGSATTFCAGGSVILTSSAASTYQWYNAGVLISGETSQTYSANSSAVYTVVVTNAAGCVSVASSGTTVTVNSLPSTPAITPSGPTTFCADGSVTLTSSTASTYQWYKNAVLIPGATNQPYSPTTSGTYTVVVTNVARSEERRVGKECW